LDELVRDVAAGREGSSFGMLAAHSLEWLASSTWPASSTLPDNHPDRMIAASIVLYVGLGIIIAITVWNHWKAAQP